MFKMRKQKENLKAKVKFRQSVIFLKFENVCLMNIY